MACCQQVVVEKGTDRVIFGCYLTENHMHVFKKHYDKPTDTEWWYVKGILQTAAGRKPMPLIETRTASRAAIASASAHTGTFGVISDE